MQQTAASSYRQQFEFCCSEARTGHGLSLTDAKLEANAVDVLDNVLIVLGSLGIAGQFTEPQKIFRASSPTGRSGCGRMLSIGTSGKKRNMEGRQKVLIDRTNTRGPKCGGGSGMR